MRVGVDEAGRGAWAGPLVAAAVMADDSITFKDSKTLSPEKRNLMAIQIKQNFICGIGWVSPITIDKIGLTKSTTLAMLTAVEQINETFNEIIIDGNVEYLHMKGVRVVYEPKADSKYNCVSAASILAKTTRDNYMKLLDSAYEFESHVGYGTRQHLNKIQKYGPDKKLHRFSYKPIENAYKQYNRSKG